MKKNILLNLAVLLVCASLWHPALKGQSGLSGTDSPAALESAALDLKGTGPIAVGNFINTSSRNDFNYLESILPTALASSLNTKYKINIIKPQEIEKILKTKSLENYTEEDLYKISSHIKAKYFVYGSFEPQQNNKIKAMIHIYKISSSSIFTFTDEGFRDTAIFNLIDRISMHIKNITNPAMVYKSGTLKQNSRLAVLTNIQGEDLNSLYLEIMSHGHKLNSFQGNSIYNNIGKEDIDKLYYTSSEAASLRKIHDKNAIELYYGTWSGKSHFKDIKEQQRIYEKYTFNHDIIDKKTFAAINRAAPGKIDYLLIIRFNKNKKEAWIRCVNLNTGNLIFSSAAIEGSSVNDITQKILAYISS